jgi:amino acid adenylation domain-containing protein
MTVGRHHYLLHHPFEERAAAHPDRTALILPGPDAPRRLTYAALDRRARALAALLVRDGVRRGDRVALFLPSGAEMVIGLLAALRLGAAAIPIHPQTRVAKLRCLLRDAGPACLISQDALRPVWAPIAQESVPPLPVHCAVDLLSDTADAAAAAQISPAQAPAQAIDQDLALILYTSGSTGEPKGVMLTHRNLLCATSSILSYLGLRDDDIIYCALPLSFGYGLNQVLCALQIGAAVILDPSFAFPQRSLQILQAERATVFPGVPTMFSMLCATDLSRHDLPALRILTNAAAALSERQIADLRRHFPHARLFSMYGQTECTRISFLPPEELDRRPTSVGRGMPNEEVYLVDDQGRRLPPGSTGELIVRGAHVMRGYWNRPEETAQKLRPGHIPGELVLHTGDIFRMDEEGFLYFVSRKDDIIKSGGEKVSPREVEEALSAHPAVQDAAVLGIPDSLLGQAVHAYVSLRPGLSLGERDLLRHCAARLEGYMVPRQVHILPALPRSPNGKIDKLALLQDTEVIP